MSMQNGRTLAQRNDFMTLTWLHRMGWCRTRDIAALGWLPRRPAPSKGDYRPMVVVVPPSAIRMAQRTLRRLKTRELVIAHRAPDGSTIYGLSEAGAKELRDKDIPAVSAAGQMRRFSDQLYNHRRISNEIAIGAAINGYRVATEREISVGHWLIGQDGVLGKKPDSLVRAGTSVWWIETQLSRKNQPEYVKLLSWLCALYPPGRNIWMPAPLPEGYELRQVIFLASAAFLERLSEDLQRLGWSKELFTHRIQGVELLYPAQAKYLVLEGGMETATPSD